MWVTWFYQSLSHTLALGSSLVIGLVSWLRCSKPHHHGWCQCRAPPAFCIEPKPAMNAVRRESRIRDTAPSFLKVPLFIQPVVAGTLWAAGLCLGILSNPPCRCKKNNRLIMWFVASKNGLQRIQHIQVVWVIPNDSFRVRLNNILSYLTYLITSDLCITAFFSRAGTSFKLRYSEFICIPSGWSLAGPKRIARPRVASATKDDPVMMPSASPKAPSSGVFCSHLLPELHWKVSLFCPHDIQVPVKNLLTLSASTSTFNMPSMPDVTNSRFGEIWTKFQYMFSLSLFPNA